MAHAVAAGHRVVLVTGTRGEQGEIVVPEMDTPENHARLAEIRRGELARALDHLGDIDHRFLGYVDSWMMGTPENAGPESFWSAKVDDAVDRLMAIIDEVRPQVIVGYNSFGGYGHPDHIRAGEIARAAFERSTGTPDGAQKLYETGGGWARREKVWQRARERGVKGWWDPDKPESDEERTQREAQMARMEGAQGPITTVIDIKDWIDAKHAALGEHVTQLSRDGFFLALTADDWRELMSTEDYSLRVSKVGVRIPEDDLFAGLR